MNILLCVKQVPDMTQLKGGEDWELPARNAPGGVLNPFDGFALEAAARMKDADPDTKVVALSMGPQGADDALRLCLAVAADKVYLLSDDALAGSDSLATSYALSVAVERLEELEGSFDAIFCGKQAVDGDTAQVPAQLAQRLGRPQVTYALEAAADGDGLKVRQELEDGARMVRLPTPCVVAFTKPAWELRYPLIKRRMAANRAEIPVLTAADLLKLDLARVGEAGSATRVKSTYPPERKTGGVKVEEKDPAEGARRLYQLLSDASVL